MKEITLTILQDHRCCKRQIKIFQETFGERAKITLANAEKALEAGLDISWLDMLLGPLALEEYQKDALPAWEAYAKALSSAWATNPCHEKYMKAKVLGWKKYQKAIAPALVKALHKEEGKPK